MNAVYYFGPIRQAGHYLWLSEHRKSCDILETNPWKYKLDGKLAPSDNNEKEGEALIHHKEGWTALSFWDRTVDKRGGSNSTYLINKILNYDEMVALAQDRFPDRWGIMDFEVTNKGENYETNTNNRS